MLQKLFADKHKQPYKGYFTITRVHPGDIVDQKFHDTAFGPLSVIDHAVMKKGLTIKMHEHMNDEILSYVYKGTSNHKDSSGLDTPIFPGKLMMMNAGSSFWHEEKVKNEDVEMLQIFVRPREADLEPRIQFHEKEVANRNWYVMVEPEDSQTPLYVRNNVYILDAHPKKGDVLDIPVYPELVPFLYVLDGEVAIDDVQLNPKEAVTDLDNPLPAITAIEDTTVVLFFVDMDAAMTMSGTISGNASN